MITAPRQRCRRPQSERILASFQRGENRGERRKSRKIVKIAISPQRLRRSILRNSGPQQRKIDAEPIQEDPRHKTIENSLKDAKKNVPKNWGYGLEGRGGPGCCFGIVTRLNMYGFRILTVHSNRKGRLGSSPPSNRRFLSWSGCSVRNSEFQNLGISQNRSSTS